MQGNIIRAIIHWLNNKMPNLKLISFGFRIALGGMGPLMILFCLGVWWIARQLWTRWSIIAFCALPVVKICFAVCLSIVTFVWGSSATHCQQYSPWASPTGNAPRSYEMAWARQLAWLGHLGREDNDRLARTATFGWIPDGARRDYGDSPRQAFAGACHKMLRQRRAEQIFLLQWGGK